jgi:lysine 6-dehydrogenase
MKVVILGGCGAVGASIVRDLIKSDEVEKVCIAGRKIHMTNVHESVQSSKKVSTKTLDITDFQALVQAIKGNNVVVNCVGPFYRFGIPTMKAAVEAGVNYLDIMDDYDTTITAFDEMDEPARKAGVSICVGFGLGPGFTNLIMKYGANKLDQVDVIRLLWGWALNDLTGPGTIAHMWHVLQGNVPQYLDGKLVYVPAGSGEEVVDFGEPYGKCPVYYIGHPEPVTIPRYIEGVKTVDEKACILPLWMNEVAFKLRECGFVDNEPIMVDGKPVIPRNFVAEIMQNGVSFRRQVEEYTISPSCIVVKGKEGNKAVSYTYASQGKMLPGTAIPASMFTQMLGLGEIKVKGVVAPEGAVDPESFFAKFAKRGFRLSEQKAVTQEVEF